MLNIPLGIRRPIVVDRLWLDLCSIEYASKTAHFQAFGFQNLDPLKPVTFGHYKENL